MSLPTIVTIILLLLFAFVVFCLFISMYLIFTHLLPATSIYYFPDVKESSEIAQDGTTRGHHNEDHYHEVSPEGMHVSLTFVPLTRNINLEGSLTAPIWCTGLFHRHTHFYLPSEEAIHDAKMFAFQYQHVLGVQKTDDGVDLIVSVKSNHLAQENAKESHDGLIRILLRREFPDRAQLEPFRGMLYSHFIQKCADVLEITNRHYQVVLSGGATSSQMWKKELKWVFEANGEVTTHVCDTPEQVTHFACQSDCSKMSGGIICVGDRFITEDALLSGFASNASFSTHKIPFAFFSTNQQDHHIASPTQTPAQRIRKALYIVRKHRVTPKSVLKATVHRQDSVSVRYTTGRLFFGIIPRLESRRVGTNSLVRSFGHWTNTLYGLKFFQFPRVSFSFLSDTKVGKSQKTIKDAPFHLCMEVQESETNNSSTAHLAFQMLPSSAHFATKLQTLFYLLNYNGQETTERLSKVRDMKSWRLSHNSVEMQLLDTTTTRSEDMDFVIEGTPLVHVRRLDVNLVPKFCNFFEDIE